MWAMGTRLDILLPETDEEKANLAIRNIGDEVERIENLLSIYRKDSIFSRMNEQAAREPYRVDQEVFSIFSRVLDFNDRTLGYFDITLGTGREIDSPSPDGSVAGRGIFLDRDNMAIGFTSSRVKIDSGAFGKGLALNSIKKILLQSKIYNAFISFGESSVLTMRHHPHGDHCKVVIRDLFRDNKNVFVFDLNDGSVSTSGNSPNNEGKYPGGHIIHPGRGIRIGGYRLIAAAGPDPLEAEVISTALFAADEEDQRTIIGNFPLYRAVKISYDEKDAEPVIEELMTS